MGSIRRAPRTNRWEARFRDPLGGQRTKTFDAKADAKAFLANVEASIARGTWRDPGRSRAKFSRVAAEWLASNPAKRATTYARDATVIRTHLDPVLGDLPVNHIQPQQVQEVIDRMLERGLGPKTIRTDYGVLRAVFSWAVAADLIDRSPCRGIRLPEMVRQRRPVVSAEEVEELVAAIPVEYRAAVLLGAIGLRQGEVFGLRVGAIDFLRRSLAVRSTLNEVEGNFVEGTGKTLSSRRTISVPIRVLDELAAHLARTGRTNPEDLVFQAPGGGPVRATNFRNRVYDPALRRAGQEGLSFHRLRHSAGHMLRELGVPLEVIQKRLGHSSIRTTADIYGSLPERVDRPVAEKLDEMFRSALDSQAHGGKPESRGADVV
ncbi:MAG: tyrosine-type recombinase/integrase [Acidimicrobiales bacterium]|jgi:integrase